MTKVKICGITRLHDARTAAAAGADFLGFIQHEESPRYVKPDVAKEIIEWVRGPEPVGVFVNRDADEINATCTRVGFTLAQLHGHESPETCAAVDVPVIKAISVQHDASSEQVRAMVEGRPLRPMAPWVSGFKGTISRQGANRGVALIAEIIRINRRDHMNK